MNEAFLERLREGDFTVHGAYRTSSGACVYIRSRRFARDYGRDGGRFFQCYAENGDDLTETLSLVFSTSGSLRSTARGQHLFGPDFETFLVDCGLVHVKSALDRDAASRRREEVSLTTYSDDAMFRRGELEDALDRHVRLQGQILAAVAGLHAVGHRRVPKDLLLQHLCGDPSAIGRALSQMVARGDFVDGGSSGFKLSVAGHDRAAALHMQNRTITREVQTSPEEFDFFVCYASEDIDLAEALESGLTSYRVWRDKGKLTLGDKLIKKINEGLSRSRYAIVILSAHFLRKPWPQAELDALQNLMLMRDKKLILPIRRGLSPEEVSARLPLVGTLLSVADDGDVATLLAEIIRATTSRG